MAGHQRHPLDDAFTLQNGAVQRAGSVAARRPDLKPIAVMPRGDVQNLTPAIARPAPGPANHNLTPLLGRRIMYDPAKSLSQPIYRRPSDLAGVGAWGIPNVASAAAALRARPPAKAPKHTYQTPPIVAPTPPPGEAWTRQGWGMTLKGVKVLQTPPVVAHDDLAAVDIPTPAKTILVGAGLLAAFYFLAR